MLVNHADLRLEIEKIKRKVDNQDKNIEIVFRYFDELLEKKENQKPCKQIGYKVSRVKKNQHHNFRG